MRSTLKTERIVLEFTESDIPRKMAFEGVILFEELSDERDSPGRDAGYAYSLYQRKDGSFLYFSYHPNSETGYLADFTSFEEMASIASQWEPTGPSQRMLSCTADVLGIEYIEELDD